MTSTFSVIIPAKNEIKALPHLLAEIARQSVRPLEVIVADAGSTDGTVEAVTVLGARVVEGGLPGPGRNAGARVAQGEVLVFLDADVYLADDNFLKRLVEEFTARSLRMGVVGVRVVDGSIFARAAHEIYNFYSRLVWRVFKIPHAAGACLILTAEEFKELKGFDENIRLAEDIDLAIRAAARGGLGYIRSVQIGIDTRRMDHDGWLKVIWTYLKTEIYLLLTGKIKEEADYTLDYQRPQRKKVQ
jgi:glycosyltransferase involved in cell wall biosynthesis